MNSAISTFFFLFTIALTGSVHATGTSGIAFRDSQSSKIIRVLVNQQGKYLFAGCLQPSYVLTNCEFDQKNAVEIDLQKTKDQVSAWSDDRIERFEEWIAKRIASAKPIEEQKRILMAERDQVLGNLNRDLATTKDELKDPNLPAERRRKLESLREVLVRELTAKTADYDKRMLVIDRNLDQIKASVAEGKADLAEFQHEIRDVYWPAIDALMAGRSAEFDLEGQPDNNFPFKMFDVMVVVSLQARVGSRASELSFGPYVSGLSGRLPARTTQAELLMWWSEAYSNCRYGSATLAGRFFVGNDPLESFYSYRRHDGYVSIHTVPITQGALEFRLQLSKAVSPLSTCKLTGSAITYWFLPK